MRFIGLTLLALTISACSDSAVLPPTAPTELVVGLLGAGAHLTWKDNASNETEYVIMRQQMGADAAMKEIAAVPFNGVAYHDEPITSGAAYVYQVIATNDGGDSLSNEATFVAP
jgi:hypothetical protein